MAIKREGCESVKEWLEMADEEGIRKVNGSVQLEWFEPYGCLVAFEISLAIKGQSIIPQVLISYTTPYNIHISRFTLTYILAFTYLNKKDHPINIPLTQSKRSQRHSPPHSVNSPSPPPSPLSSSTNSSLLFNISLIITLVNTHEIQSLFQLWTTRSCCPRSNPQATSAQLPTNLNS